MAGRSCERGVALEARGVVKLYPDGTLALRGVDLVVCQGEVHALLGENGAGKTTLMRIVYGEIGATRGEIRVFGRRARFRGPRDALRAGVAMVYQHFSLVPGMTAFENIYIALSSTRRVGPREARRLVERVAAETGLGVPLDEPVEELPVGLRQRVELLKALALGARLLILDEPTSTLSPLEAEQLFQTLEKLKRERGVTVVLITHKLREVMRAADWVTVMRRGRVVGSYPVEAVDERLLARLMVGEELRRRARRRRGAPPRAAGEPLLVVEDLWVRGPHGWAVKGVSLEVRAGEILGIAGVQGNGQRELAEAIAGLRPAERGRVVIGGVDATGLPPGERYRLGLAYVVDERRRGLVLDETVVFNSILTGLRGFVRGVLARIDWGRARGYAARVVEEFNVVTPSLDHPVRYLSGGNQQKLMIGRDVARGPRVLVVAEPTHGLDVAAAEYVRSLLDRLRGEGRAVLMISSDLDEVLELSDRVAVMHGGRIVAVRPPEEYTLEELGLLMGGAVGEAGSPGVAGG